jgi:hypothetical protein
MKFGMEIGNKYPFFLILVCEAIGTAATPGLLFVPASGDSEDDCAEADEM